MFVLWRKYIGVCVILTFPDKVMLLIILTNNLFRLDLNKELMMMKRQVIPGVVNCTDLNASCIMGARFECL